MMRVVDTLPDSQEITASGLTKKDFRIDPKIYRHFVELYRRDCLAFQQSRAGGDETAKGSAVALPPGWTGETDEAFIEAFDGRRPPYHFHLGSIYRYRIDRSAPADRPIILERLERSEITGSLIGLPFTSQQTGLLTRFCLWIEDMIEKRESREKS